MMSFEGPKTVAIFFDIDGTLGVDTSSASLISLTNAFQEITGRSAEGIWDLQEAVGTDAHRIRSFMQITGLQIKQYTRRMELIGNIIKRRSEIYCEELGAPEIEYFPDIVELVDLARYADIGIITGNPRRIAEAKIKTLSDLGMINRDLIFTGEAPFRGQLLYNMSIKFAKKYGRIVLAGDSIADITMFEEFYTHGSKAFLKPPRFDNQRSITITNPIVLLLRESAVTKPYASSVESFITVRKGQELAESIRTPVIDTFKHVGDYWFRINAIRPDVSDILNGNASHTDIERLRTGLLRANIIEFLEHEHGHEYAKYIAKGLMIQHTNLYGDLPMELISGDELTRRFRN